MLQSRAHRAAGGSTQSFQIAPVLMLHTSNSCSVMVIGSVCLLIPAPPQSSHTCPVCILAPVAKTHLLCDQHMCGTELHNACTG